MLNQAAKSITTTKERSTDDASSIEPRRSSVAKVKDLFSIHHSNQQHDSRPQSQKKEMELAQRRLEVVARYDQDLQERITDASATVKERSHAATEKRLWDGKTQEQKEAWVTDRMILKEGWGAGVYPEGACGPGMWYR